MVFNKRLILGGALAGALVVSGGVYAGTALAQTPSPSASASSSARAFNGRQDFLTHLAQRLNISLDQLQNAMKGAAHDEVAAALQAGRITQDQANRINQRIDSGQGGGRFGFGPGPNGRGPRGGHGLIAPGQVLNAAAQALNMQPSDLTQRLRSGQTLQQVAGSNWPAVQQAITNAVKPALDQAVQSGRITAQQEQDLLNRLTSGNFPGPRGPRPNRAASPSGAGSPASSASPAATSTP